MGKDDFKLCNRILDDFSKLRRLYINIVLKRVNLTLIVKRITHVFVTQNKSHLTRFQSLFLFILACQRILNASFGLLSPIPFPFVSQTSLISEREDGIDEEHRPVDDGQRSLGDGQPATLGLEAAFPGLQDQDAGRDEHGASEQAEE